MCVAKLLFSDGEKMKQKVVQTNFTHFSELRNSAPPLVLGYSL